MHCLQQVDVVYALGPTSFQLDQGLPEAPSMPSPPSHPKALPASDGATTGQASTDDASKSVGKAASKAASKAATKAAGKAAATTRPTAKRTAHMALKGTENQPPNKVAARGTRAKRQGESHNACLPANGVTHKQGTVFSCGPCVCEECSSKFVSHALWP